MRGPDAKIGDSLIVPTETGLIYRHQIEEIRSKLGGRFPTRHDRDRVAIGGTLIYRLSTALAGCQMVYSTDVVRITQNFSSNNSRRRELMADL